MQMKLGKYRHYKGKEYELLFVATHSETLEPLAVYKALYGSGGVWARPLSMWDEDVTVGGETVKRFTYIGGETEQPSAIVMQLNDEPFFQMQKGEKTVELRLYDEKRKTVKVGDEILFVRRANQSESVMTKVRALHIYPSFADLFSTPLFEKAGLSGTREDALLTMRKFYGEADENRFGVVGIEIVLLN
jgi:ASC-1-like (ASCH) protein